MKYAFLILVIIVIAVVAKNFDLRSGLVNVSDSLSANIGEEVSRFKQNNKD